MFAIVDIETCGSKFEFKKSRIIDICIVIHDGLTITDVYSTLINPECQIPPFYSKLTGITNEMVRNAPKFHEVAADIVKLTEGRIFVAHNVDFDYNFIRAEFASLRYKFNREKLCTLSLSRKLLPGKLSYSLGNLCASLNIENTARHRAEGDAVATAKLFSILLEAKSQHTHYKNVGVEKIMTKRIDNIKPYILSKLPEECGVYFFYNKEGKIIYVGKSTNIYKRALSHFNNKQSKAARMISELTYADYILTGSELIAILLESEQIKKHQPIFNKQRIQDTFTHCIDWYFDEKGIVNFSVNELMESINPLQSYTSKIAAREALNYFIDEFGLCMNYCNVIDNPSPCFNHQIKKCHGICAGEESTDDYNIRAQKLIKKLNYPYQNFACMSNGRNANEKSFTLVENFKYRGFGYIDNENNITNAEDWKRYLINTSYFPDHDILLRSWIKSSKNVLISW